MKVSITTPVWGCSAENLISIAKMAEDSGIYAILSPEVPPYSGLSNASLMKHQVFAFLAFNLITLNSLAYRREKVL